jgi:GT2 family glycosyltransferase
MVAPQDILITIVIVSYRVPDYLKRTLLSLREADLYNRSEVIVVDNASHDDTKQQITSGFPEVAWVGLKKNIGFGKACNVGAKNARGAFVLFLNPDTLVSKNTLSVCVDFFSSHPDAGIMGPKILNADGSLQAGCRRSYPSPIVAFYRFAGLSRLFPKSSRFGTYNLTYLDPDKAAEVDAVSGSFMFIPTPLFRETGGFDETFFMYGEDLDLCCRIRAKGRSVWYNPETKIIHFKGRSAAKQTWQSRKAFYEAMIIFSRKYKHTHTAFFPDWLILVGIMLQAGTNFIAGLFRTFTACFIDLLLINAILWGSIIIRFSLSTIKSPYSGGSVTTMLFMHALLSLGFLGLFFYRGVYSKERYSPGQCARVRFPGVGHFHGCGVFYKLHGVFPSCVRLVHHRDITHTGRLARGAAENEIEVAAHNLQYRQCGNFRQRRRRGSAHQEFRGRLIGEYPGNSLAIA